VDFYSVRRLKIYSAAALGLLVAILVGVVFWLRRRPGRATAAGGSDEFPSTGRHSTPDGHGTEAPPNQPYPAYADPAVSAMVGSPRAPAGVR
jgi:hypothetical protein